MIILVDNVIKMYDDPITLYFDYMMYVSNRIRTFEILSTSDKSIQEYLTSLKVNGDYVLGKFGPKTFRYIVWDGKRYGPAFSANNEKIFRNNRCTNLSKSENNGKLRLHRSMPDLRNNNLNSGNNISTRSETFHIVPIFNSTGIERSKFVKLWSVVKEAQNHFKLPHEIGIDPIKDLVRILKSAIKHFPSSEIPCYNNDNDFGWVLNYFLLSEDQANNIMVLFEKLKEDNKAFPIVSVSELISDLQMTVSTIKCSRFLKDSIPISQFSRYCILFKHNIFNSVPGSRKDLVLFWSKAWKEWIDTSDDEKKMKMLGSVSIHRNWADDEEMKLFIESSDGSEEEIDWFGDESFNRSMISPGHDSGLELIKESESEHTFTNEENDENYESLLMNDNVMKNFSQSTINCESDILIENDDVVESIVLSEEDHVIKNNQEIANDFSDKNREADFVPNEVLDDNEMGQSMDNDIMSYVSEDSETVISETLETKKNEQNNDNINDNYNENNENKENKESENDNERTIDSTKLAVEIKEDSFINPKLDSGITSISHDSAILNDENTVVNDGTMIAGNNNDDIDDNAEKVTITNNDKNNNKEINDEAENISLIDLHIDNEILKKPGTLTALLDESSSPSSPSSFGNFSEYDSESLTNSPRLTTILTREDTIPEKIDMFEKLSGNVPKHHKVLHHLLPNDEFSKNSLSDSERDSGISKKNLKHFVKRTDSGVVLELKELIENKPEIIQLKSVKLAKDVAKLEVPKSFKKGRSISEIFSALLDDNMKDLSISAEYKNKIVRPQDLYNRLKVESDKKWEQLSRKTKDKYYGAFLRKYDEAINKPELSNIDIGDILEIVKICIDFGDIQHRIVQYAINIVENQNGGDDSDLSDISSIKSFNGVSSNSMSRDNSLNSLRQKMRGSSP